MMMEPDENQREMTRLCMLVAQLLLQHGVESSVVVQSAVRLGKALGAENVQCGLTSSAIMITTIQNGHCITTIRQNADKGINMQVVTEVQRIVVAAEHRIYDMQLVREKLEKIKALKYNRWLVVFMIGLSCACFAHLAGGDHVIFMLTFLASSVAMWVRQELGKRHFNPMIVFCVTAFVASLISGLALTFNLGNHPQIAQASSVLLLVPGFPLVNALADCLKGYISMGIARWTLATSLTFAACLGIVLALNVLHLGHWGG
ncbi:threonine/serine ThrE exporter family protein [Pasteurellaceae bacterium 22721_9_1]